MFHNFFKTKQQPLRWLELEQREGPYEEEQWFKQDNTPPNVSNVTMAW